MKDVKSFCKLFDLNVPSYDDFDYYKSLYRRIGRFSDIDELVNMYEELEETIDDMYSYRMECTQKLIDYIKETRAYGDLNLDPKITNHQVDKNFKYSEGKYYVSFDLKKANWQAVKSYDPFFKNELGSSWEELVESLGIPKLFARSKHLRQFVFGNLNPKKMMYVQRRLVESFLETIPQPTCVKYDEVIFEFDDLESALNMLDLTPDNFKSVVFTVNQCDGFRINNYLDNGGNVYDREPVGCNGHKYFIALKREIFKEPLDKRDLYFRMDGELAMWIIPDNIDNI